MRIVFGYHLDGPTFPETADGASACFDALVAGPQGLLGSLETQLGLNGPPVAAAERIAAWQARLAALDGPEQFYHASFAVDAWATARALLRWRDDLVAAGWKGAAIPDGGPRLETLAALEALDAPVLPPGRPERLRAVCEALAARPELDVEEIRLVDAPDRLPAPWRRLLNALAETGVRVLPLIQENGQAAGDLGRLQRALRGDPAEPMAGDGTVVLIEAEDTWQAADAAASWLAAAPDANDDVVIVRGDDPAPLDQACHDRGLPRIGADSASRWRGALQVLPLAFEIMWAPFNPQRLLELLTLPQSPIPPSVARFFADALREAPGVECEHWQAAWEQAAERRRQQVAEDEPEANAVERKVAQDLAEWRQWLAPGQFDPEEGIPADEALAVCRRVQRWAMRRAGALDDALYRAAVQQAAACERAIRRLGAARLPRVQLGRILDEVIADGIATGTAAAEAAPWAVVDAPGQIWAGAGTELWWGFNGLPVAPPNLPWTKAEQAALARAGIALEPPAAEMRRQALAWRRPVLHAAQRLILMRAKTVAGEEAGAHPLWHEVVGLFGGRDQVAPAVVKAARLLEQESVQLGGRTLRRATVAPAPLPGERPQWPVAPGLIGRRATESASSLEKLLGCPLAWTLRYPARVKEGALVSVADDASVIGTIAHKVVETLFSECADWTPDEAARRAEDLFDALVARQGATLLLPGRELERRNARTAVGRSVGRLVALMNDHGLAFEAAEARHEGAVDGTPLEAWVDLVLRDRAGRRVILDMKWTNHPRYKRAAIEKGEAVQLATYAAAVDGCRPGGAGYFMLRQGELYFAAPEPFPDHAVPDAPPLPEVWRQVERSYTDRMQALEEGNVTAAGLVEPPEDAGEDGLLHLEPPCRFCGYTILCGWKGNGR